MTRAPRRGPALPVALWVSALLAGGGAWGVAVPLADALRTDPRVGSGRALPALAPEPSPVLPGFNPAATPLAASEVARRLEAVPTTGAGQVGAVVLDSSSGKTLYSADAGVRAPASTMKVLSTVVALDVLGQDRRFATRVVRGASGQVILVGGGDPLLVRRARDTAGGASLEELADRTAAALAASGATKVSLGYDDSAFTGPGWHPDWPETFRWSVAPVTALKADQARARKLSGTLWERHRDPSGQAARAFAALLRDRGVDVTATGEATARTGAAEVAAVESLPVSAVVEHILLTSDNDAAEALARHVAAERGRPASFAGAGSTVAAELRRLGLWSGGMVIRDSSGISADGRVAPLALARAVRLGLADPRLRAVVTGLPVAGVTGTLEERFDAKPAAPGRGFVRAKTGTIRGVNTLAGYAVSPEGHVTTFAFMTSGGGQAAARAWLDAASATLAR